MNKEIVYIKIEDLFPHPNNPRKEIGDVDELAASIKTKGIMQNLTVVPRAEGGYTVIIGHRRTVAARKAGLTEVPCIIAELTEAEQVQTMLLENMQRSDLTVYEQAQGFQMMMDFGDTVETVSEKTGFSPTTIRRRLKMVELDANILKQVSDKQITFEEIDKLSQIEDISTRNLVLASMGSKNFNNEYQKALDAQKKRKKKEGWESIFKKYNMVEIDYQMCFASSYENLGYFEGEPEETKIKEYVEKYGKIYYAWGYKGIPYIRAAAVVDKEKAQKRKEEEKRRALAIERRGKLADLSERTFNLRLDFVKNFSYRDSKKNVEKITDWMCIKEIVALSASYMFSGYATVTASKRVLGELFGVTNDDYSKVAEFTEKHPEKALLFIVYAQWCDSKELNCCRYDQTFEKNIRLYHIYNGLVKLGYEMSDEEIAMMNGTHELYQKNETSETESVTDENTEGDDVSDDDFDADLIDKLKKLAKEVGKEE